MKTLVALILLSFTSSLAAQQITITGADGTNSAQSTLCFGHNGVCVAQTPPPVIVEELSKNDVDRLAAAQAAIDAAVAAMKTTRDGIIQLHGGFIDQCDLSGWSPCATSTGQRLSDEVLWKGNYLILTRRYEPEL